MHRPLSTVVSLLWAAAPAAPFHIGGGLTAPVSFARLRGGIARMRRTPLKAAAEPSNLAGYVATAMGEALGVTADETGSRFQFSRGGGGGGGGGSVGTILDTDTGAKFFCKSTSGAWGYDMLHAEQEGVRAMHEAGAIRVPRPICDGVSPKGAYAVFEYLQMGGSLDAERSRLMGQQLAQMHRKLSENGKYGFHVDNTIGATEQPNGWMDSWTDFWVERRLKHMIRLCERDGAVFPQVDKVVEKTREVLSKHSAPPSLVHGDLWGGNAGCTNDGDPVIFDPATYYGDREVDIAMTYVFGFPGSRDFYHGYEEEWPLPPGHESRRVLYNVYHILNHYVLFGGGYASQAQRMMGQILAM